MLPDELVSPRLRVRPPRQDDAAAMFEAWTRDPDVTRYLTWRPHGKPDQTATFVAGCIEAWRGPSRRPWVITRFGENVPIGLIELRLDGHRAELGYVLARSAWGQGYMTEAVQTVVHAAFDELPLNRVSAVCDVDNLASARVLDKAGLQREGVLRRYIMHPNISDEPRNVYLFARTRPLRGSMSAGNVLDVLAALAERHVPVWVGGGWGIDALLGDQTREHTDLDLAIRAEQEAEVIEILTALGYRIVLDYRPSRLAMADDDGHEVDLHPVRFDMLGNGVQPGLHGPVFHYPREGFAHGRIAGQPVACLSAERQASFHTGYPLRAKERQDLERLRARFGTAVPTSSSD